MTQGPQGLSEDAPHGPSKQRLESQKVRDIVEATLHTKPNGATHWSTRTMAKAQRVSHSAGGADVGCSWTPTASRENF